MPIIFGTKGLSACVSGIFGFDMLITLLVNRITFPPVASLLNQ